MRPTRNGGRQAALLLLASGLFTLANNYLPGSEHLDVAMLNVLGGVSVLLGVVAWFVRWERLHPRAPLVLAPIAFGMIATANLYGGVSPFSYAVYFVVVFVWIGISQPPTTWLYVMPLAVTAYVVPLLIGDENVVGGVDSVTVAMPVCALVAETIARTVRRLDDARAELLERAHLRERLVEVVADVSGDLDPESVLPSVCRGVRHLIGADASSFVTLEGSTVTVRAVSGVTEEVVGFSWEVSGGAIGRLLNDGRPVVMPLDSLDAITDPRLAAGLDGMHTLVAVPTRIGGDLVGALYALFREEDHALSSDEIDALSLVAGHIGAAVHNAQVHAALARLEAHEQAVIGATADGMAVVDPTGVVRSWNQAAERLTGVAADQAIGSPLFFSTPPGSEPVNHQLPDGRWLEVVASELPTGGELVVNFRDISKAKALEEAKDVFLATTSHELRTPLTVIKGFTSTLQHRWDDLPDDLRRESLDAIAERTDALISLVDHLLLGVRAGAGRHSLHLEPTPLRPLLDHAVEGVRSAAAHHTIAVHLDDTLPPVLGDATALGHVLGELIENAVKYSPRGSTIEIVAEVAGPTVTVTVSDRGIGLARGAETTIFDRFVQADGSDRRPFGGVGLGLHIVRTLVEAMGGSVMAAPRAGGGSVFSVRLRSAQVSVPRQVTRQEVTSGGIGSPSGT